MGYGQRRLVGCSFVDSGCRVWDLLEALRRGVYPDFGAVMSAQLSTLGAPAVRKS